MPKEPERFWSKVDICEPDECWEWQACEVGRGYGGFQIHYKLWRAHRVAWILTYGPIPKGLFVLHKCDNPGCCNPYHLFLGTQTDNMADAAKKGRLNTKLTKETILKIRELYATGKWTQEDLAIKFKTGTAYISDIIRRKTWKHI